MFYKCFTNYGKFGDGLYIYTMALLTWDTMMNSPTLGISWSRQLPSLAIPSKKSMGSGHLSPSLAFVHKLIVLREHALPGRFFRDISCAVALGLGDWSRRVVHILQVPWGELTKKMAETPWFTLVKTKIIWALDFHFLRKPQKTSENLSWNWVWWSAHVSCLRLLMI